MRVEVSKLLPVTVTGLGLLFHPAEASGLHGWGCAHWISGCCPGALIEYLLYAWTLAQGLENLALPFIG